MSEPIHLLHDVMDKLVLDRDKHRMGRVDEIVLQITENEPPRVVYVELGGLALARRVGRIARWTIERFLPKPVQPPYRIAWDRVRQIDGAELVVDVDAESSRALAWERWLAKHVAARLGG